MSDNPQDYIDDMARSRGYVLDYHKVMAKQDFPFLQAANNLVGAAYLNQRSLDRTTKELIFIVSLTVMRASKGHIQTHIRVALDLGLSPRRSSRPSRYPYPRPASWRSRPASRRGARSWASRAWSPPWLCTRAAVARRDQ